MAGNPDPTLSRRERQIMDIIYRRGQASAAEVLADMPDPPSYSAVRAMLRILEEKGHLEHREEGTKYVYTPTRPKESEAKSALKRVLETFFAGSAEKAIAALLSASETRPSDAELERVAKLIDQARKEGR